MDENRTAFEAYMISPFGLQPEAIRRDPETGEYDDSKTQDHWLVWRAASGQELAQLQETLRDKFAARAMQSFLRWDDAPVTPGGEIAKAAYLMADKMLEERSK